jgi:hypothetical protein
MTLQLPISLCMVVCNEAHRLGPMLAWHRPLVAQIVVVVQRSDDDTLAVACQLADVVIEHPRYGYCEASREAASHASAFDTQLVLDADEWLTLAFALGLPAAMDATRLGEVDGYRLRRTFWRDGRHEFTGDAQYRLIHRRGVRFLNEIHTEPQAKDWKRVPTWGGEQAAGDGGVFLPEQLAILHVKTTEEQIRDELRCQELLSDGGALAGDPLRDRKLALNVHLPGASHAAE